jgi:predicted small lipoprotein YifL
MKQSLFILIPVIFLLAGCGLKKPLVLLEEEREERNLESM